jgi:hypothetical protein
MSLVFRIVDRNLDVNTLLFLIHGDPKGIRTPVLWVKAIYPNH